MMPYTVMAGLVIAAIVFAIVGGGSYWWLPALILPAVLAYALVDRRLKARESRGERLAAEPNPR